MPISGLKLSFGEDGEVEVENGKRQLPHRVGLVEEALNKMDHKAACEMIFNYTLRDCRHATSLELNNKENELFQRLLIAMEETEKKIA